MTLTGFSSHKALQSSGFFLLIIKLLAFLDDLVLDKFKQLTNKSAFRIGIFGAMIDGNIKLSNLFCEMRLLRSLRPLRLLRLLRSLRPQIFQGLENHY